MAVTSLYPPLNQTASAGTHLVLGYATQAPLAGAYYVGGSLGLQEKSMRVGGHQGAGEKRVKVLEEKKQEHK